METFKESKKDKIIKYFKRLGWIGFFFFLGKGIIWLVVFYLAAKGINNWEDFKGIFE